MSAGMWREFGICGQTDPELFFSEAEVDITAAKKLCAGCPSLAPCLTDALANGDDFGVRGGLTADERKQLPVFTHVGAVASFLPPTDESIALALKRRDANDERRAAARSVKAAANAYLDIHPFDRQVIL
jgi:hypothetical protein